MRQSLQPISQRIDELWRVFCPRGWYGQTFAKSFISPFWPVMSIPRSASVLAALVIAASMLLCGVDAEPSSFPVADCTKPCGGDYQCFLCHSGAFKARCFSTANTFPNMACCTSNINTATTCDAGANPRCCESWKPSGGVIAAIVIGSLVAVLLLALGAWWLVRRHRRSSNGYEDLDQPSPTLYAEQFAHHRKRDHPYAARPPDENTKSTYYGSYQSF